MTEKLDEDFVLLLAQVTSSSAKFTKHLNIRIEQWVQKLQQSVANPIWKKHRNEYALVFADMVRNSALKEPFIRMPPEGPLPKLARADVLSIQFPILSTCSSRLKSPLRETRPVLKPANRVAFSPSPHKLRQPRSPSFGTDEGMLFNASEEVSKRMLHSSGNYKKRSTSLLPTADNIALLAQQLEEANRREAVLQETIASQAKTIKEQQAVIATLQAKARTVDPDPLVIDEYPEQEVPAT